MMGKQRGGAAPAAFRAPPEYFRKGETWGLRRCILSLAIGCVGLIWGLPGGAASDICSEDIGEVTFCAPYEVTNDPLFQMNRIDVDLPTGTRRYFLFVEPLTRDQEDAGARAYLDKVGDQQMNVMKAAFKSKNVYALPVEIIGDAKTEIRVAEPHWWQWRQRRGEATVSIHATAVICNHAILIEDLIDTPVDLDAELALLRDLVSFARATDAPDTGDCAK